MIARRGRKEIKGTVLILVDSSFVGGPEKYIFGYAKRLQEDLDIILCSFLDRQKDNLFLSIAQRKGMKTAHVSAKGPYDLRQINALVRVIQLYNVDIINSHGYRADIIGWICSKLSNILIMPTFHGWTRCDWKVKFFEYIDAILMRKMDSIITVSEANRRKLIAKGCDERRICVVPNAIDLHDFFLLSSTVDKLNLRAHLDIQQEARIIVCVGRISREKGQKILLHSFREVLEQRPQTFLLLVGDGPDRKDLERSAYEWGIHHRVIFLGFRNDISHLLEQADLMAMPSLTEGLPTAILEAFACKLPVIATSVGGVPEIVLNGKTGLLVPPGDPAALRDVILRCLDDIDKVKTLGIRANKFLKDHYTFDAHSNRMKNHILNLLSLRR